MSRPVSIEVLNIQTKSHSTKSEQSRKSLKPPPLRGCCPSASQALSFLAAGLQMSVLFGRRLLQEFGFRVLEVDGEKRKGPSGVDFALILLEVLGGLALIALSVQSCHGSK